MAQFKFYLNRQGVRGAKGDKGDKGFSPSISLGKNTQEEFTLFITNEDETIETPNIKEGLVPEDRGGTYVRKDPETGLQYYGDANIGTTDSVGEVQLASYDDLKNTELGDVEPEQQPAAGKAVEGLGAKEYFASKEDLSTVSSQVNKNTEDIAHNTQDIEDNAYNIQNLGNMTNTLETEVNSIKVNLNNAQGKIEALQTGKQNKLVEGDNITLTNNDDGTTTISSSGGGGGTGDVTAAGNNTFTGNNIFKGNSLNVGNDNEYSGVAEYDGVFYNPIDVNGVVNTVAQSKGGVTLGGSYSNSKLQSATRQEYYSSTKQETYLSTIFNTGNLRFGNGLTVKKVESDYDASPAVIRDTYFEISTSGSQGSPLDEFIEGSTDTNTTTITAKDGKVLKLDAPTIAIGDNLVNTTEPDGMQLYLKQGDIAAGDNITVEKTATGVKISSIGSTTDVPIATTEIAGKVKPDGTSITITEDGTISAVNTIPSNMVTTDTKQNITGLKTFKNNSGVTIAQNSTLGNSVVISPYGTSDAVYNSLIGISEFAAHTWNIAASYTASKFRIQNPVARVSSGEGSASSSGDRPLLTVGKITAGDNITITDNGNTGITISASGGGFSVADKNGIEADYKVKHGIIDNPNGIISYSATSKDITVNQGLVLNCAGNGPAKTTIATAIPYTVTSTGAFTLFYANGNLLECGKVDYSTVEPEDNGVDNYQAWFNPDKEANPDGKWQFKSNDTGNVFREVDNATPIADFVTGETGITSVSYLGYRILDDDVFAQQSDIESIQNDIETLTTAINDIDTSSYVSTGNTIQNINGIKRFISGIRTGIEGGYRGSLDAGNLHLGENGSTEVHIKADETNPLIDHYGKLSIRSKNSSGSCEIVAGTGSNKSNLLISKDVLTYTKTDGTELNLLSAAIGNAGMPSGRKVDLTLGASGAKYTAPADGWVLLRMPVSQAEGYISIHATSGLAVNNYSPQKYHPETYLPVKKGQKFTVTYASGMSSVDKFSFYYAEGTPS